MPNKNLIIKTYNITSQNVSKVKRLIGATKRKAVRINPSHIRYDVQRNRYFQTTNDAHDIFEYLEKAATAFLEHRHKKSSFTVQDIYRCIDNFMDRRVSLPTSEFRVMRGKNGEILGGFSSNVRGDELHVSSFFLDKKSKKRVVMKELFEEIKSRAREFNCKSITTNVVGKDELKRSERLGFKEKKKNFLQTLFNWKVLAKYVLKNKRVSCPIDEFGKNWLS